MLLFRYAEDVYNSGKFNFTMLEWAIKEIVKEEAEEEKNKQEEEARLNPPSTAIAEKKGKFGNLIYLLLLIPIALMVLNYFVI
jgi:hypothetical protein